MTQDWIIGFIWANGAEYKNPYCNYKMFRIQNWNMEILTQIAKYLGLAVSEQLDGKKIIYISHKNPIYKRLFDLGWLSRNNMEERCYPKGTIDDLEFMRGYCTTKASIGYRKCPKTGQKRLRLRIEGAYNLLESIDRLIVSWIGSKPKKVQTEINRVNPERHQKEGYHHILYYQSQKEVLALADLLGIPLPGPDVVSKRRKGAQTDTQEKETPTGKRHNNKKHTIQEIQAIAEAYGGKCLSSDYSHSYAPLTWQCAKGHIWDAPLKTIKYLKTWCPVCAGKLPLTIEEMQRIAEAKGGKCLSTEYLNVSTALKWECAKGHIWEATPEKIKYHNSWCPVCNNTSTKRLTIEEMQAIAKARGGRCLSTEYINKRTPLTWECANGHIWEATPEKIKYHKSWCPVCEPK